MPRGGKRKGAGRKPKYDGFLVPSTYSFPADLDAEIKAQAKQYGVSKNQIVIGNLYLSLLGIRI